MKEYNFMVGEEDEGERIDAYLSALLDDLSRSYVQKLLKNELVLVDNANARPRPVKASHRIKAGDNLRLSVPDATILPLEAEDIPLDILYEDDDLLVINKARGMVVHPAPGHHSHTLVHALLFHCQDSLSGIGGILRPGIVHRLDKDTSGALIVCKNDLAHQDISRQLKERSVERRYWAIVRGTVKDDNGTIAAPIERHPKERKKMAVAKDGREAITHYRTLERFNKHSLLECRLETGRTHQIRVHLAHIAHPVLGDPLYGNTKQPDIGGQALHAKHLSFIHPTTGERHFFEAPLPGYFTDLILGCRVT